MKNFKKNIGFAVVLVLLAGFASSCSNDSGDGEEDKYSEVTASTIDTSVFVGTWKLSKYVEDGATQATPNITITFTTTTYSQTGDRIDSGKYFATATKLTLKSTNNDDKTMTYVLSNGDKTYTATMEGNGSTVVMTFNKQ